MSDHQPKRRWIHLFLMISPIALLSLSALLAPLALAEGASAAEKPELRVGSKKFTESVVLGEIATHLLKSSGVPARHRAELGGTRILWNALLSGEIDAYPEYTGTLIEELLHLSPNASTETLRRELEKEGLRMTAPLGFNNTYALGMKSGLADRLGIRRISDLAKHPEIRYGLSNEFKQRQDGWPRVQERYRLQAGDIRGLDHDIAYRAIESDEVDVIDLYSTDAEIQYYRLRTLDDDLNAFPRYDAVFLYRSDLESRSPKAIAALSRLEGKIPQEEMIQLNAQAKIEHIPADRVAQGFLESRFGIRIQVDASSTAQQIFLRLSEHLRLVTISMTLAIFVAIPLGVLAAKKPRLGQAILTSAGIIQTIPALALLVILIRPLKSIGLPGIGDTPAVVALFLYSLLPIIRNTHAGLLNSPTPIRESATALGLPPWTRLRIIELPLASPMILAGIKTAAVINIGFATLGALIGAGGFGQPILAGIRLDDYRLILQGAVPSAALAIVTQFIFAIAERYWVPRGLKISI